MTTPSNARPSDARPGDFDHFWRSAQDELARVPAAPEVEEIPLRSTDFATAYGVRLTSTGPYRIYAYLSVPKGDGPLDGRFPAKCFLPRYGSVVDFVPQGSSNGQRRNYVTFSICARGQRRADQPYAAAFPGMLTDGITAPATYIYRGIVADCCRGLEYLASRLEVDGSRVAAVGTDLALVAAAFCPQVTHLVSTPTLLYRTASLAQHTTAYPLEEINDYLRLHPSRLEQVNNTLSYFDLRWFASQVTARTLVVFGADGSALEAAALEPLVGAIEGEVEVYKSENSGFKDGVFIEEWLAGQFGLSEPSLPPHWRDGR